MNHHPVRATSFGRELAIGCLLGSVACVVGCSEASPLELDGGGSPRSDAGSERLDASGEADAGSIVAADGGRIDGGPMAPATASFGPNGTHWPSRTPRLDAVFDFEIEAESASWPAIERAIETAMASTPTGGDGVVWVPDGALDGNGAGSTSRPVLEDLGEDRERRILVAPRNGFGAVTASGSWRMLGMRSLAFVGFDLGDQALNISGSVDFAWARSRAIAFQLTGIVGRETRDLEFVECVTPDSRVVDSDTWGWRGASDEGGAIENVHAIGCYVAPSYRTVGSGTHCDSWQLSGREGDYGGIVYEDCAVFASTNAAVQIGSAHDIELRHTLVVAGDRSRVRYPPGPGAGMVNSPNALNGGGQPNGVDVYDSVIVGNISGPTFGVVERSSTNQPDHATNLAPTSGAWTYDPSLTTWTAAEIDAASPYPDDAYLRSIWD